jgi:exopolysaccharide biosynthesis predicted pyruvyltransferase EpsI
MLFSCAHDWTKMAASAGYLSALVVPDMSAHHHHQPGVYALSQPKEQILGIFRNDENNNTHSPELFTVIDPFWLVDVVVVVAVAYKNEPSGTHHDGAELIDLISNVDKWKRRRGEYRHDVCACHCHCYEE